MPKMKPMTKAAIRNDAAAVRARGNGTAHPISLADATMPDLIRELVHRLGEDPLREGLLKTPERASAALEFMTRGYRQDPRDILKSALFTVSYDEMVIVKDIEMFSLCEH